MAKNQITRRHWICYYCGIQDVEQVLYECETIEEARTKVAEYLFSQGHVMDEDYAFYLMFDEYGKKDSEENEDNGRC